MDLFYRWLFPAIWLVFLVYWQVIWQMTAAGKASVRIEPAFSRITRAVAFLAAIALLMAPNLPARWLYLAILPGGLVCFYLGAAITVIGLGFAVWARVHLGRNWSRSVQVKEDHELITSGPYRLVRHPIYTGILAGFVGSVVAEAQLRGVVALLLVFGALWAKLRLEEAWMRGEFGEKYTVYARRVRALVPGIL
ncbi:MAG TPA: isoprenylcysteine carboxylmethyltransferase family protein [Terracidiphilus sp.]|nr:isoprenylcysteine carboxylmethyltransferase family protein [Terracidiphilus sp.]